MKLQTFAKNTFLYQLIWNVAWVLRYVTLGRSPTLTKLVRIPWAVETPRGVIILWLLVFFVFLFFNRAAAHTREPIFAHTISKRRDLVWGRHLWEWEMCNSEMWGCFTLKTPLKFVEWAITSQNKMSNSSEKLRDTRNMSLNHDYETGVALSDSFNKTCVNCP